MDHAVRRFGIGDYRMIGRSLLEEGVGRASQAGDRHRNRCCCITTVGGFYMDNGDIQDSYILASLVSPQILKVSRIFVLDLFYGAQNRRSRPVFA